jgi:hypothetical protein
MFAVFIDQLADALAVRLAPTLTTPGTAAKRPGPSSRERAKGEKRAPALIARTTSALLAAIKSHNGQRIEQLAAALGMPTSELKLPAKKLLSERKVKTKGQKRGTQYFAA